MHEKVYVNTVKMNMEIIKLLNVGKKIHNKILNTSVSPTNYNPKRFSSR